MDGNRMTSVEIQAVTVDDAVRLALEQLGLGLDDVDVEILSDAGLEEDEEALVRVTAKGMASQPEVRAPRPAGGGRRQPGARRVPGDRPSSRGTPPRERRPAPRQEPRPRPQRPVDRVDAEDERIAKELVSELIQRMGVAAEVVAVDNPSLVPLDGEDPATIFIDILGRDLGQLIGRRGDNLGQLQYLVNLLVNHHLETFTRVILDVEGYRSRREESLIGLAERVGRQVARSQRPMVLEPMPPNERRVIHLSLRGNPEVTTESSGEGNMRRVTVQPSG